MLEEYRQRIEKKRQELRHKIDWIKIKAELEAARKEKEVALWNVVLESQYDTTEFEFVGTFPELLQKLIEITDQDQVTQIRLSSGPLPNWKGNPDA